MRTVPTNRRSVQTAVLICTALGAAVWIDLAVLTSAGDGQVEQATAPPGDVVVDVTVPGSPDSGGSADAAAAPAASTAATAPVGFPTAAGTGASQAVPAISQATPSAPRSPTAPTPAAPNTPVTNRPPTTTPPAPTTTPTTQAPPTTTPTTQAAPATTYHTATYAGIGDVVVAETGGRLEFWSCTPASGWGYRVEKNGPSTVEVKFRRTSGEGEAKIEITRRSNGTLSIKREN